VLAGFLEQLLQQEVGAVGAFAVDHGLERIQPLSGFLGVQIGRQCAGTGVGAGGHGCVSCEKSV
jgi:hypothetical protein